MDSHYYFYSIPEDNFNEIMYANKVEFEYIRFKFFKGIDSLF